METLLGHPKPACEELSSDNALNGGMLAELIPSSGRQRSFPARRYVAASVK